MDSHHTSPHIHRIAEIILFLSGQYKWNKEEHQSHLPSYCKNVVGTLIETISDISVIPLDIFKDHVIYNRMSVLCIVLFDCALFHTKICLTDEELRETQTQFLQLLGPLSVWH